MRGAEEAENAATDPACVRRNTASSLTEFWVLVLLRYEVLRKGREEKETPASWDSDWSSPFAQSRLYQVP